MISFGKNIISSADQLQKISVESFYRALRTPKPETVAQIRQLRIVRMVDAKSYGTLKRQLPYVVCGIFNPPFRRGENFAYIEYFILDIDKVTEKGLSVATLRTEIQKDPQVHLCFVSPSEDGLKIMFRLSERCYDKGLFSVFYKKFSQQFAQKYNIEQVIDSVTSDVTRACFVSIDPEAYYNPDSECVSLSAYVDVGNMLEFFDLKHRQDAEIKQARQVRAAKQPISEPANKPDVDADVIANIKAILNPDAAQRVVAKPPVYVPEQLNDIMDDLKQFVENTGLVITDVVNIQYGKKIQVRSQMRHAEVNLYYGRKGYSVVRSTRTGTDPELNGMVADLVTQFINS